MGKDYRSDIFTRKKGRYKEQHGKKDFNYVEVCNSLILAVFPANIYMFKVNNRNTRTRCEICLKLTVKTPFSRVFIVDFEQVHVSWVLFLKINDIIW